MSNGAALLFRRAAAGRPNAAAATVAATSRGLVTKRAKAKAKGFDLGWEKLREPLEAAPLHLPALVSLKVIHGRQGAGLAGARKFSKIMPALRWHNPGLSIVQRWDDKDETRAAVVLELANGSQSELDVSGRRSEQILGMTLQAAGSSDIEVARGVDWATGYLLSLERRGVAPVDGALVAGEAGGFDADGECVERDHEQGKDE